MFYSQHSIGPTNASIAAPSYGGITSNAQFGSGGAFKGFSMKPADALSNLSESYQKGYQEAVNFNRQNRDDIQRGYQTTMAAQQGAQAKTLRGYRRLLNATLGDINQVGDSQREDIRANYEAQAGSQAQRLIDSGLGNSTVQSAVMRGLAFDENRAGNDLAEKIAMLRGNTRMSIGGDAQGFRERSIGANTNLSLDQLHWMNSMSAPYPDMGAYAQMAQMYGMQQEMGRGQHPFGGGPTIGAPAPPLGYAGFTKPQSAAFYAGSGGGYEPGIDSGVNLYSNYGGTVGGGYGSSYAVPPPDVAGYGKGYFGESSAGYGPAPQDVWTPDPSQSYARGYA